MPLLFLSCQHQKNNTDYFLLSICVYGLSCVRWRQWDNHAKIYHHCFKAFSSFMVVFTTGVRLNLTIKVSIDFLCVYFDRNKQQPQHSWTIANVLAHFNVFLFSLTYKNSKLAASSSDFEGWENLTSPAFARVNLLKVSVSRAFPVPVSGTRRQNRFLSIYKYKTASFLYTRLKKSVSKHQHLSLRQHQKICHVLYNTYKNYKNNIAPIQKENENP